MGSEAKQSLPTVIMIVGSGRSGTTLLQMLLAQYPDSAGMGESLLVADRAFRNLELCGCGEPLTSCPSWGDVLEASHISSLGEAEAAAMLRRKALRWLNLVRFRLGWPSYALRQYLSHLRSLFACFAERSSADVLIDSSGSPLYAAALSLALPGRVALVHVVRDPRAVAYSLQRKVRRPDVMHKVEYMPTFSPFRSTLAWLRRNLMTELVTLLHRPSTTISYEQLAEDPALVLAHIRTASGLATANPAFIEGNRVTVTLVHSAGGNPRRFERHDIIVPDDEWRERLHSRAAAIVSALSLPLLFRYRYPLGQAWRSGKGNTHLQLPRPPAGTVGEGPRV